VPLILKVLIQNKWEEECEGQQANQLHMAYALCAATSTTTTNY